MNAIETLISVLCDSEGKCCISGSDDDRRIIDSALAELTPTAQAAESVTEPAGWKTVPVNPTPEMWKAAKTVPDPNPPYPPHYGLVWDAMLAASPTPPAEQAATKAVPAAVGHDEDLLEKLYWEFDSQRKKTGEDRLAFKVKMRFYASEFLRRSDGKMTFAQSVSDDMMNLADRLGSEFDDVDPRAWKHLLVYAPKAAPGERLTREQIREVFMANGFTVKEGQSDLKQYVYDAAYALLGTKPAPLSDDVVKDAARLDWLALAGPTSICVVIDRPHDSEVEVATDDVTGYGKTLREALDAAIAAQGGAA